MCDEDRRFANGRARNHEPRREGHNSPKKIAVAQSKRERIRRTVGESLDHDLLRLDPTSTEELAQCSINKCNVGSPTAMDDIPGSSARIWSQKNDPQFLGAFQIRIDPATTNTPRPVEHHDQRPRPIRRVHARHEAQPIALIAEPDRMQSRNRLLRRTLWTVTNSRQSSHVDITSPMTLTTSRAAENHRPCPRCYVVSRLCYEKQPNATRSTSSSRQHNPPGCTRPIDLVSRRRRGRR
jgi:hypothetical protein